jgi:hypothetical protein
MKWKIVIPAAAVTAAVIIGVNVANLSAAPRAAPPGVVSAGGATAVLPVSSNPISNTATASGLIVVNALAENNVDAKTNQPVADRLEVTLKNTSSNTINGFEIYYTMTDAVTKKSESYYLPLTGLSIAAGESATVFFDNQGGSNHYGENTFSIYRNSKNQVDFAIEVSAHGVAVAKGATVKSAGTGEVVGG